MTMLPPDPLYIFKGDMEPVFCLMFRKVGKNLALFAGTQSGMIHIWDLKTNRETGTFESSKESCISLINVPETSEIITQDKMGVIRFWIEQEMKWELTKKLTTDYYGFCRAVFHNDSLYIPLKKACVENMLVKTKEKGMIFNLSEKENEIMCFKIFVSNNETFALVAFESCDICLYSFKEKKVLSSIKVEECPMALDFEPVTSKGVCGCPTEKVLVFTINKNNEIQFKKDIILKNPGVASVAIRPDGKILSLGCWDGKIRLYSMKNLSILAALDIHWSTVQDVAFFNIEEDNKKPVFYLAAASKDCKMSLWNIFT